MTEEKETMDEPQLLHNSEGGTESEGGKGDVGRAAAAVKLCDEEGTESEEGEA